MIGALRKEASNRSKRYAIVYIAAADRITEYDSVISNA